MSRPWKSRIELADALAERAATGETIPLSPRTAKLIARMLRGQKLRPGLGTAWDVDLFATGSCVLEVDDAGNVLEVTAWAKSTLIAHVARRALREANPETRYEQRRRGWVEAHGDLDD